MGVATGITMEFQFGTNWAYYAHYVGDIFGAPLAIEGLMAFFLEATFIGLFFFGWNACRACSIWSCTWLVALGTNLSALWILIANGWMQNPVGARFNIDTMRMEVTDFCGGDVQPGGAGQVRAHGLRRLRHRLDVRAGDQRLLPAARPPSRPGDPLDDRGRQLRPGLGAVGRRAGRRERLHGRPEPEDEDRRDRGDVADRAGARLASPSSAFPTSDTHETDYAVRVPWVLGLIATRSIDGQVAGIDKLCREAEQRIKSGMIAYGAMETLRAHPGRRRRARRVRGACATISATRCC